MSLAISAQNSKVEVETGTGAAKTITAIALGNPTILTSAAHGLGNGDVVTLAGLTGVDAAVLNGQVIPISNKTTNTFAVNVDTTGKTITAAGTATPVTYTEVAEVKSFTPPEATASESDVTHLKSTAKEFMLGLVDNGEFSMDFNYVEGDAGQNALSASNIASTKKTYKVTLPNNSVFTFGAFCKGFTNIPKGGVDSPLTRSAKLRISGGITKS